MICCCCCCYCIMQPFATCCCSLLFGINIELNWNKTFQIKLNCIRFHSKCNPLSYISPLIFYWSAGTKGASIDFLLWAIKMVQIKRNRRANENQQQQQQQKNKFVTVIITTTTTTTRNEKLKNLSCLVNTNSASKIVL